MNMTSKIRELKHMVMSSKRCVVFTGAGISAESGIPTYRGDDGLWQQYDPSKYASVAYFNQDPSYYWRFFKEVRYPMLEKAQPNEAHFTLSRLEKAGVIRAIITQNIDGLHQASGAMKVLELHGSTRRIVCLNCNKEYTMTSVFNMLLTQLPPKCSACGGLLRPDVVFFGESLPEFVLNEAIEETEQCDLFLVVGSSLVVQPAASLPVMAKRNGAKLAIINIDPTPLDSLSELVIRSGASDVLKTL